MKTLSVLIVLFTAATMSYGQGVAINETGLLPDASAMLDISSIEKGFLVPRMMQSERNAIDHPATGLLIFQTDGIAGFYFNAGTPSTPNWQPVKSYESVWTEDSDDIYYNAGNVGIGTSAPSALLHTNGTGTGGGNILFTGSLKSTNPGAPPTSGPGTRMMWYPDKAALRAGNVAGTNWNADSTGNYSMALGNNTKAKADNSVALGNNTAATGYASTALGSITTASGTAATSTGIQTRAAGHYSTAMGSYTTAPSGYETVIGRYNTQYTPLNTTGWNSSDRLFVIGKGTSDAARSNALTVLKNGNAGIGTDSPTALLHTEGTGTGQGNVLFAGQFKETSPGLPPITGAGTRMMWYPDKAALRAGYVAGTSWNIDSIGNYSVAFGYNTRAKGNNSLAMGTSNIASGFASIALGSITKATGTCALATGIQTQATGNYSMAMGSFTTAPSGYETVIGNYNTSYTPVSTTIWNNADRLFVIGNGTSDVARSNAMTIMKNGKVGIGTDEPEATLDVAGAISLADADESPQAGMIRWNSTTEDFEGYDGSNWRSLTRANSGTWGVVAPFLVNENQKATSSDGEAGDGFGQSVSVSGEYAIVGASEHNIGVNIDQGAAYIFHRSGNTWIQQAKLVASDGAEEDWFGNSVSISGDYAIVGAWISSPGGNLAQGSAYIYFRTDTVWTQQAKLVASDGAASDYFGWSVDIAGHFAIVGAPYHDTFGNSAQGAAYIFYRSGTNWTQSAKLTASDGEEGDFFGRSVAMTEYHALVGAPFADGVDYVYNDLGEAYIFERSGMSWLEQEILEPNSIGEECFFGASVDISGDQAIVGAPGTGEYGEVYIFENNGGSWDNNGGLIAFENTSYENFGGSVAISNDIAIIGNSSHSLFAGAQGAAYVYRKEIFGWTMEAKLTASDYSQSSYFGTGLSFDGNCIIVGASGDDVGENGNQGSVYFFNK